MILISGTSNKPLAQKVAKILGVPLGKVEITRFIDNECRVFVQEEVAGQDVYVVQSLSQVADQHLVELCLLGTALRDLGAKTITAVVPWMGYSKQDKAFRKGEAVSASLVAKFIEVAGFQRIMTFDLHSENLLPYFRIQVRELSAKKLLADALPKDVSDCVVVSPDRGGKSRSEAFAKLIKLPVVYLEKTRNLTTGKVAVTGMSGEVRGRDVILFDDIINTAATAVKTSDYLKSRGAKRIFFLATHAVLAGDAPHALRESRIDKIIVSDTIEIPGNKLFAKLSVISVAPIIADALSYGNPS